MEGKAASLIAVILAWSLVAINGEEFPCLGPPVTRESRRTLATTDSGLVTAVDVNDGYKKFYHLQFITMEPGSLFLPVLLHADMVFYVQTGSGTVSYTTGDGTTNVEVERGDIYGLQEGTIFYVISHPDSMRGKLRINAIFHTGNVKNPTESFVGAYSTITCLVRGFEDKILKMGFGVSEEIIRGIKWMKTPPIIPFTPKNNESSEHNWEDGIFESLIGFRGPTDIIIKKKNKKTPFNIYSASPDEENCNGWSIAVTGKQIPALKGSNSGVFLVNLTKGSMMGPHWNPRATEIAVVIEGQGMVQVVCASKPSGEGGDIFECQNMKFRVKEDDVFVVPRYHPMVQISFNNNSFVFMGFSFMVKKNHPQFLVGKKSVLKTIDREILELTFNSPNTTIKTLLTSQRESIMLECTSCAEELEKKVEEEIERQKQEEQEARKKEEEEARRREEEEARKREEEEARRREEEEEARREEEEEAKRREEEEARKREEEAKRREEEEARKREEEAKRREEEEARKREEEAKSREEEEEARRREEEEAARKQEEEAKRREEEEARKREEEEAKKREEEEARKREEEAKRREEEEEARRREEEEEARKQEEEAKRREEEEARKREEEEAKKREEEARRREEEEAREKEEKEATRREEEEAARKREEKEAREEEEATRREEEEQEARRREEARRWEEYEAWKEAEAAVRRREEEAVRKREKEEARRKGEEERAGTREEEGGGRREEEEPNAREWEEEDAKSEKRKEKAHEREEVDERQVKWKLREVEDEEGRVLWKKMWRF